MRRIPFSIGLLVAVLGLGPTTAVRAGNTCVGSCVGDLTSCVQEARNDKLVCRDDCRSNGGGGGCMRDCRVQGGTDRKGCRTDAKDCVTACADDVTASTDVPSDSPACEGQCGQALSQCLRDASAGLPACLDSCPKSGSGRSQCVKACQDLVASGMQVCQQQHQACLAGCAGATTSSTIATSTTTVTTPSSTTVTSTSSTTSSTVSNLCGNGVIDPGEECDTEDFGDATCPGSSTGAFLVCTPECTIDFSQCPGATTTSTIPGTTSSTSTSSTSSSSTSSTLATTTSSTLVSTTTSTSVATTSSTSTSVASTSSTSTSIATTSSTSTSTTSTIATTTTSSTVPSPTVLSFVTGAAGGTCGAVKSGGSLGTVRKSLTCGGLNIGGGQSTVAEGPTPGGAETQMNVSGSPPNLTVSGRTAAQTGNNLHCSDTGCVFGPFLPIASAGTSTCVQNSFLAPGATGTVNTVTGNFTGTFPLNSDVFLTANGTSPCPRCLSGVCDPAWTAGTGNPYPDSGKACTAVNANGDTYDCAPPAAAFLGPISVNLNPITTGTASKSDAGGNFCPSQANSGAFGCAGVTGAANAVCPGGNAPPLIDYIEEIGAPAGPLSSTPASGTLASVFCIPTVGGSLGFLVNSAGNLPGPGATSLPGTLALLP